MSKKTDSRRKRGARKGPGAGKDGKPAGRGRKKTGTSGRKATKPARRKRPRTGPGGVVLPRPFTVRKSKIQGLGGFATRWIDQGTRIIEYTGERVSHEEGDARYIDDAMDRHHTFLFTVDEDTVIDAAVGGNEARFINHCCDPNCEAVDRGGRIFIEALRDIAPGEELFYDYGYELGTDRLTPELKKQYPCTCGSPNCRGTILARSRRS